MSVLRVAGMNRLSCLCLLGVIAISGCSPIGKNVKFKDDIRVATGEEGPARPSARELSVPLQAPIQEAKQRAEYIEGTGVFAHEVAAPVQAVVADKSGGVSLTFKNTDIRIVVRAVLADTLGLSYGIDPQVQGNVTLETSGSISKDALRMTLETVLKTKGFALVDTTSGLQVLPLADAPRNVRTIRQNRSSSSNLLGFGVQVVPLSFTLPSEMEKLIEPFAPKGGILLADDSRQLLLIAGTPQELTGMLRAVETFDINTMTGKSFAIFSLNYVEADEIVKELKELFNTEEKTSVSPVYFMPVPRINKIIAIAANKGLLRSVENWIDKLDLGDSAPGRRIYVYQVKNGRAIDMADTLNLILGNRNGRGGNNSYGNSSYNSNGSTSSSNRNRSSQRQNRSGSNSSSGNGFNNGGLSGNGSFGDEGVRIVPSEENNSIVIMAMPSEFAVIETALNQIDVPPRQVLIEMTLAEVGLTDELRFGLQWQFDFDNNAVAFGKSAAPSAEFPGFSWQYTGANVSAVLNTLESMSDVKVISSPKILVLNNQSATLQIGDEVPVPSASSVSTTDSNAPIVNSIQYRNTGVILTVTPRINDSGLVMLDVEQEMSNVVENVSSGIDAPIIQQRKLSSSIAVQNGSTIALGGLINTTVSDVKSGVPILKDIPILGHAFSSTDLVERRSEMVVLLTPRIIRDVEETKNVMEYLRREFRSLMAEPDVEDIALEQTVEAK